MTQGERITKLETQVTALSEAVHSMDKKLDQLVSLRDKGSGAFTLVALIVGSGLLGLVTQVVGWFTHAS